MKARMKGREGRRRVGGEWEVQKGSGQLSAKSNDKGPCSQGRKVVVLAIASTKLESARRGRGGMGGRVGGEWEVEKGPGQLSAKSNDKRPRKVVVLAIASTKLKVGIGEEGKGRGEWESGGVGRTCEEALAVDLRASAGGEEGRRGKGKGRRRRGGGGRREEGGWARLAFGQGKRPCEHGREWRRGQVSLPPSQTRNDHATMLTRSSFWRSGHRVDKVGIGAERGEWERRVGEWGVLVKRPWPWT